jgi:O-antigen ligase
MNVRFVSFITLSSFAIYLLPLALISGPFIPDLIVSLLSFFFLIYALVKKLYYYFKNIFFYSFLIFWLICIFSSIFSEEFFLSITTSITFIRHGIFVILIYFLLKNNSNFIKSFFYITLITICFLLLDAYIQKFLGYNFLGKVPSSGVKISGLFGDEEILGTYLLRISPILMFASFFLKNKKEFFLIFFYLLIEPMIFYSGQRSIFYMSLCYIFGILLFVKHSRKSLLAFLILILFLSYNLFLNKDHNNRMIKDITENYTTHKPQNYDVENKYKPFKFMFYSPNQTILWISSLNIFMENKILGAGPNVFRKICEKYKPPVKSDHNHCSIHPHNFAFQLLAETGLLGFVLYIFFYLWLFFNLTLYLFKKFFLNKKFNTSTCILIVLILINFCPFIPNGNFFNNYLSILNFLPFGFLLNSKIKIK